MLRLLFLLFLFPLIVFSQSNPVVLDPNIQLQRVMTVKNGAIRIAKDHVTGDLLYATTNGDIYKVLPGGTDTLIYTTADHGVQYLQGMRVHDSTLFVSGNN